MLLDHFHPPLSEQRNWKGFHNEWATYLSADINRQLPPQWFATTEVEFGVEIDVAAIEESLHLQAGTTLRSTYATENAGGDWSPSAPHLTIPLPVIADVVEVQVYHASGGNTLVGAIELVSPRNKDRPDAREAFVAKCESLVVAGIGVVVVDIVTERHANLHRELLNRLDGAVEIGEMGRDARLYAAAYHPVQRDETPSLDVWHEPLEIGGELPVMPLFLRGGPRVRVDLGGTYQRTCEEQRIPSSS
jgi:hypothetical protein